MRSLDFNTRTQVTRYGPAVLLSCTPMPPRAPSSPGRSPSWGPVECVSGGTQLRARVWGAPWDPPGAWGHRRRALPRINGWKEEKGGGPGWDYVPRAVTWGSAAGRLRCPGLRGLMPPGPAEPEAGEGTGKGPGVCSSNRPGAVACREAINRLYEAVPGVKGIWKKKVSFIPSWAPSWCEPGLRGWGCLPGSRGRAWGLSGHPSLPPSPQETWSWGLHRPHAPFYPLRLPTKPFSPSWARATSASLA